MPRRPRFALTFAPEVLDHLDAIEPKYHGLIRKTIDERLRDTPGQPTRNRKLLEQPAPYEATWELRFGPGNRFRVFYDVVTDQQVVWILAIGVKDGNRLLVGGEEIKS
jgi:mRNA-degrading endonuclease RelE of RelBE toxin-antitoxin system